MDRRTFLQVSSLAVSAQLEALADTPMPMVTLGKSGLRVSKITVGGFHMRTGGEKQGIDIIHRAMDLGVNFFDSAHKYHNTESDVTYGKALAGGRRQKVILMTKAHLRDKDSAMKQLEDSLRNMKTDYLDLWQCHEVAMHTEVDRIFGPNGALEAFVKAKKEGKVRHIGFTGHHDPTVHLRLLNGFDGWETLQCPVNLIDPHYLSFIRNVLPAARGRGLGILGMKSNAIGNITKNQIATIPECLRFSWSQDIDTLVSGVQTVEQLEQNVVACKTFQKMTADEQKTLLSRTREGIHGSAVEQYKRKEAGANHPAHHDGEIG